MGAKRLRTLTCDTYDFMHLRCTWSRVVLVAALAIPVTAHADDPVSAATNTGDGDPAAKVKTEGAPVEPPSHVLEPEKRMPQEEEMVRNATRPAFVWKPFGFLRLQYIAVQD